MILGDAGSSHALTIACLNGYKRNEWSGKDEPWLRRNQQDSTEWPPNSSKYDFHLHFTTEKRNSSCSTNKAEIKYTPLTPCPVSFHTTITAGMIYVCDAEASGRGWNIRRMLFPLTFAQKKLLELPR